MHEELRSTGRGSVYRITSCTFTIGSACSSAPDSFADDFSSENAATISSRSSAVSARRPVDAATSWADALDYRVEPDEVVPEREALVGNAIRTSEIVHRQRLCRPDAIRAEIRHGTPRDRPVLPEMRDSVTRTAQRMAHACDPTGRRLPAQRSSHGVGAA